jgi:hypothetical protein
VVNTIDSKTLRLIKVVFDRDGDGVPDGEFEATGEHPLWTSTSGWMLAEDIAPGARLQTLEGKGLTVLGTQVIPGFSETYNLSVEGVHTFFIVAGGSSVLVHNEPPRIHGIAPDWATKGVHVTSEGIELGIRGGGNAVKVVPIFSSENPAKLKSAIDNVETWLKNETWRGRLLEKARAATSYLGNGATPLERAASGSTRALEVTLERWCK